MIVSCFSKLPLSGFPLDFMIISFWLFADIVITCSLCKLRISYLQFIVSLLYLASRSWLLCCFITIETSDIVSCISKLYLCFIVLFISSEWHLSLTLFHHWECWLLSITVKYYSYVLFVAEFIYYYYFLVSAVTCLSIVTFSSTVNISAISLLDKVNQVNLLKINLSTLKVMAETLQDKEI